MKTMESTLKEEMRQLEKVAREALGRLKGAPNGHLRITTNNGRVEYYYKSVEVSSSNGRYIKKNEESLARAIAQRDYDALLAKSAVERIKVIKNFLEKYEKTSIKRIYQNTNGYRRDLISAVVISDEEYVKRWQAVEYEGKAFAVEAQEIITERGERVRSKSEKIIADKLYMLGIPYRYEYPLMLEGNIKIYPDFTILKMSSREEVYLEHLGLMDDSSYVDNVMYKLNTYERNRIYLGVNLFTTYETSKKPLNSRTLDGMIRKLFLEE
ncbi:MAG: hypothetical protein E7291_09415 [Lachnospiraceae bacterium]|nr:hypothetical protein [Lachnospiraceae bacterium]